MEPVSDDELLLMYRAGEAEAFDALFDRHHRAVYNFAVAMLGRNGEADEVLQETFLCVARHAEQYSPRGRFRSWLMRIARNRCLNCLEARRLRRAVLARGGSDAGEIASPEPSPARLAEAHETHANLREALGRLPDRQRETLALYAFEHMTYREIAEVLDMPINTVKTLIHRARAELARRLGPPERETKREL